VISEHIVKVLTVILVDTLVLQAANSCLASAVHTSPFAFHISDYNHSKGPPWLGTGLGILSVLKVSLAFHKYGFVVI